VCKLVSAGLKVAMKYFCARAENMAQGYDGTFVNRLRERRRQEYLYHFDTVFEPRTFFLLLLFFPLFLWVYLKPMADRPTDEPR
jgi:hypothetical protein